jgi:nucleoside-diphosphate-sugar epimerase
MKKKILLTGVSGTVGKQVLSQLIDFDCYEISIVARKHALKQKELKKLLNKVAFINCDLSRPEDFLKINGQFDIVIHLAAIIPPLADKKPKLAEAVNTNGTINLIKQLEKVSPNAFFMYSSSISVYGDRLYSPKINVSDPLSISFGDEYAKTKINAEKAITNSSLNWTIFRLSAIMGIKNHKMSGLMFHMPLDTSMEICTPSDTARAFVNGIDKIEQLNGGIYNLGGGEKCRTNYKDFLEKNFELNGLGKPNFPFKTFAEKNFHCGFYADGDELEEITNFRKDTLEDYYQMNKESIPIIQKIVASIFKGIIKYFMQRQSEPLKAFKEKDQQLMNRFFKTN